VAIRKEKKHMKKLYEVHVETVIGGRRSSQCVFASSEAAARNALAADSGVTLHDEGEGHYRADHPDGKFTYLMIDVRPGCACVLGSRSTSPRSRQTR
jgi:hypothetical protein